MTFWQYLIKNGLWYFVAFIVFVGAFLYVSSFYGPLEGDVKLVVIAIVILVVGFLVGNYVSWKRSR